MLDDLKGLGLSEKWMIDCCSGRKSGLLVMKKDYDECILLARKFSKEYPLTVDELSSFILERPGLSEAHYKYRIFTCLQLGQVLSW